MIQLPRDWQRVCHVAQFEDELTAHTSREQDGQGSNYTDAHSLSSPCTSRGAVVTVVSILYGVQRLPCTKPKEQCR